jgi:hypothetical protein
MKTNLDNTKFNHDNKVLDGEALKMRETRLKKELENGTITKDGEIELKEIRKKLQHARNIINKGKEITQDTDYRNTFRDEKSATEVSTPKVTKKSEHSGKTKSKIMTNDEALSENIKKEISSIRYLIEYMDNNNKKQKL